MNLYAENILDHFKNPRGVGEITEPSVEHEELNLSCGDKIKIQLIIEDDKIKEAVWDGTGCAISIGAMSILSEELEGKSVEEVNELSADDVIGMLGVPISNRRMKCALMCLHTLKNAMRKFKGEEERGWPATVSHD
ncbi:iron-sulfur cluster assembly scaffold protein [Patescibacteria group bacterium]|nr:iron-sulfur cluster assembly scaffold protein [Patescibacteria group bacterium]MBU1123904.1 iron-sulfur cluster assembly scaffold protein [Patescibacteria group bacterium]